MNDAFLLLAIALVVGVGVPYVGMRMLAPSLAEGHRVPNFRGAQVFPGLGIAWFLWAGAAVAFGVFASWAVDSDTVLSILLLAGMLALVAFALGLVDDAYGTRRERGFRGHVRALARGRLTTGGLKLLGISAASYVSAVVVGGIAHADDLPGQLLLALPAGAAVALTANFVNLTDLRPGRALKVYSVLGALGAISAAVGLGSLLGNSMPTIVGEAAVLLVFVLGPVVAIWRYDVGELGMLGDSGANAGGAVAGLLIVAGLPVWATLVYLLVVLGLNLSSERYSFTALIESSPLLHRIDMLGRLPLDEGQSTSPGSGTHEARNP